ncbi:cyclic nucleotide-binding domain-containing protein 2-like [Orbicella faveolata]|uniref:cyclic nucleotide-binding domain-containing protein 2-like n=1 Tax=Orbicella faveolata TaxID=48498 RepID=UPI0009E5FC0C|nr:cyclic nucleotide-binding domain-containing protein 2-like [Orbicella faveolata]
MSPRKPNLFLRKTLGKGKKSSSFTCCISMFFLLLIAFKSAVHSSGHLSKKAKFILMKNPWQRKEDEMKLIYSVVDKLKCFNRYTSRIKQELARVVYFQQFGDGRVVVQQGHPGRSMYFIVSGNVLIQVTETDKRTGCSKKQIVGEMFAGDSFGELALLHDIKRAATIICKGTAEFLTVDKPDFNMVLKKGHQQEWETRISLLRSLPYFSDYTTKELEQLNTTAKLVEYPQNTVILRDVGNPGEFAYFIRSGQCQVIQEMTLVRRTPTVGKRRLILPPVDTDNRINPVFKVKTYDRVKKHFLVICRLGEGDYFGVGENFSKMSIVSVNKVRTSCQLLIITTEICY